MEFINFITSITLFGTWWIFSTALLLWIYTLFVSEYEKNGLIAVISTIIFFSMIHHRSNANFLELLTLLNIIYYFGMGIVYSFIKTYFYAKKGGEKYYLKDNIFRWWFLWPISLLYWIFSDLLKDLYKILFSKVSKIYNKIFEYGNKRKKNKKGLDN